MLHKENLDYNRGQFGFYSLNDLVPHAHFLRQVEEAIDFSFIYNLVAGSYSDDMEHPILDPVLLFKIPILQCFISLPTERIMFVGFKEGIFTRILELCVNAGFIDPTEVFVDGPHIRVAANNRKFITREVEKQAKFMTDQLEIEINRDR